MKKVVLLNVGFDFPRYDEHLQLSPPLGILAVGSYLLEHDVPVELIDVQMDFGFGLTCAAEQVVCQRVARYLQSQADEIAWVGLSQLSNTVSGVTLAEEIRSALPETPIVFGGYFPSGNYEFMLRKYPAITAIVRGDGEAAALHISRSLAQGQSFLSEQAPNLAWLCSGEICANPIQPMNLDNLPILDFRLLRNVSHYPLIIMMTSRGCPFRCNYCLESDMRSYAAYSPEWVARQLDHLETESSCTRIGVFDPIFGVGRKRTSEMCQVMGGRRFTYGVEGRVDILKASMIPSLRQAGVEIIFWGIESASPATLVRMDKVRSEVAARSYLDGTRAVLKACFENDIAPMLGFMLGFPGDVEADLQATLEFAQEVRQLYDRIAAQTNGEAGFVSLGQATKIYDGSPLSRRVAQDFPQAVLVPDPALGESTVLSPSPGVTLDLIRHYETEINSLGHYTPKATELLYHYSTFAAKELAVAHPELTDEQGVTVLCDGLRHFPRL